MDNWRPISTAPFNERVLIYRKDQDCVEITRVEEEYVNHPMYAPTHWMPLPERPNKNLDETS